MALEFEWDPAKAERNLKDHEVSFDEATTVFRDTPLASAQEAIRLWIDTAREFGDPIPKPKGRRLVFA